jgi:hypothetical protein
MVIIADFSDTDFGEFVTQEMRLKFWNEHLEFHHFGHAEILPGLYRPILERLPYKFAL